MKILALDVGEKRIGVARADSTTRIAVPVGFIAVDGSEWQEIARLAHLNSTNWFILGLPRSNEGNETQQSLYVRNFAKTLTEKIPEAKIRFQDESLTSVEAEERLKRRKKNYEKGEIDAEAATIILQDFLEAFKEPEAKPLESTNIVKKETHKVKRKMKTATKWISGLTVALLILVLVSVSGIVWAKGQLDAVDPSCDNPSCDCDCQVVEFTVSDGDSKSVIAENLEQTGLIKNAFIFNAYLKIFKPNSNFKSGKYLFSVNMTADEIIAELERGSNYTDVFSFTVLPGENIYEIQANLIELGYSKTEVNEAFNANYDFDFLKKRPAGATLEGYLYGETYEFYNDTPVKEILEKYLFEMGKIIAENNLEARYAEQGLSLHEGVTLASVVQKEAPTSEMPTVAQVFLSRIAYGIPLGSDVTVSYALDTVDPDRQTYVDNQTALSVDSCYNTRLFAGLPCGPISNPGLSALLAVAEPADTSYLYFLTGDDGMMYYSYTESEHNQNIYLYCKELCNVSL
ncbi:endolytic transglycosylase MltG [Candidatus Saccharibacteria bacterium]|nr:endolytic transglycosylase MltG [Candidatus Saccharibacteria bacterium]